MTLNSIKSSKHHLEFKIQDDISFLTQKYEINAIDFPVISSGEIDLPMNLKILAIEKLLEAYELAKINKEAGNITNRGFGANVCNNFGIWSKGTNFNNTRNDISSICAERSAILSSYNEALIEYSKRKNETFNFKIKYICMAQDINLEEIENSIIPCEDCLSWFNTTRYFSDETLIFSFEKNKIGQLSLKITKLIELLPQKNLVITNSANNNKIEFSQNALNSIKKFDIKDNLIFDLNQKNIELYKENKNTQTSNQNIVCSIFANEKIYSSQKIDWTKRWFTEPLETATIQAINENSNTKITAIAYFGDEFANNFKDGVISIKSLGRIRQKYATNDTLLILNLKDKIFVMTIQDYLPQKFAQGYKII